MLFPLLQVWVHGCTLQTLIYREQREVLWEFTPQRCNSRASDKGRVASSPLSRPLLHSFPLCRSSLSFDHPKGTAGPSMLKDVRLRVTCLTHLHGKLLLNVKYLYGLPKQLKSSQRTWRSHSLFPNDDLSHVFMWLMRPHVAPSFSDRCSCLMHFPNLKYIFEFYEQFIYHLSCLWRYCFFVFSKEHRNSLCCFSAILSVTAGF